MTVGARLYQALRCWYSKKTDFFLSIHILADVSTRVTCRSSRKGCMDSAIFSDGLNYFRIPRHLKNSRTCIIWVNNCTSHKFLLKVQAPLRRSRVELQFFLLCATYLVQPDEFLFFNKQKPGGDWEETNRLSVRLQISFELTLSTRSAF